MISLQIKEQLNFLSNLLLVLTNEQYRQKITCLGNASIGAHSRHIIELLKCVYNGYDTGVVDYLNRPRNLFLETDRSLAIYQLNILTENIIPLTNK